MRVLVCGGAGYIGSHTVVELVQRGHEAVVLDNFCNSSPPVMDRIATIVGQTVACERSDVRDHVSLRNVLARHRIEAVIHFAALKAVGESWLRPLDYFDNNIGGTISLLRAMRETETPHLVFSSSATVYGEPERNPIPESAPRRVTSPYGRSKLVMEDLIGDVCSAHGDFRAVLLRYFNPVGAHPSGLIGEDPVGSPNNLMPYICQVAVGLRPELSVFGDDYATPDGTGVRDYLHVQDLARAHVDALNHLKSVGTGLTVNLGTGRGHSVLELIRAFEKASSRTVPYRVAARRPGDVAEMVADASLAGRLLGWKAEHDLERMCVDAWRWQSMNPKGFGG
jgi:UDP-glucose 4-epimerase